MALLFVQCTKDDEIRVDTQTTILEDKEQVTFLIQVVDEADAAIPGATLINLTTGQSWSADERGLVLLSNLDVPAGGLPIAVETPGKMKMVKLLHGKSESQTAMTLQLYPYDSEMSLQTGATGTISGQGSLTLPEQLVQADGSSYTGEVTVQSHYYDPADTRFLERAPGDMSAIGADGNRYTLQSYGMYAVELRDAAGNELSLPEGSTAKLQFPVPSNYNTVPDEMPLWSMDENTGKWIEEGTVVQQNGFLEAEVSHFSWWNCDLPFEGVNICMKSVDTEGNALSGVQYLISSPDQQVSYATGWTDTDGEFCQQVPADQPLSVNLLWEGEILASTEIGSFDQNADLGDVTMDLMGNFIRGYGVDCNNSALSNVLVEYSLNGTNSYTLAEPDGFFNTFQPGNGTLEVQLFQYQSELNSEALSVDLTAAQSVYDLGQISLCEDLEPGDVITVVDDITQNTTWTTGNTYLLNGRIIVKDGATLTIEPGTVVKANTGELADASYLIIARGADIVAEGTSSSPIVFTSIVDDITPADVAAGNMQSPNLSPDQKKLWGGLVILGNAPISASGPMGNDVTETVVGGLSAANPDFLYGGNDPADGSGTLRYVSIRHGGVEIAQDWTIAGLYLGGVGNGTTIEHLEMVGTEDDGIAVFGGTVAVENAVVWNAEDDAFDTDNAWLGTLDNFVLFTPGSSALELDGPEGSLQGLHTIQNGTIVMNANGRTATRSLLDLDNDTQCSLKNLHYVGPFADGQTVTNNEVNPATSFENVTFDIDAGAFDTLFEPSAPIPAGCSAGGSPQADASVFNWTWIAQSGNLDNL